MRALALTVAAVLLASVFALPGAFAQSTVQLTVASAYADGAAAPSMWSTIRTASGILVASGFTPLTANVLPGLSYTMYAADYSDITLQHWEDTGTFERPRAVTISASSTFTAVYVSNTHPLPEPEPEPDPDFTPITHMADTTQSYGVLVSGTAYSGNHQIAAEFVNSGSVLVGKPIDEITMMLQRVGNSTGNVEIAVFDANRNVKKMFATISMSSIPTSMTEMVFAIPDLYTIAAGDRIGLRYTGGSTSSGVSVMMDKVTSDTIFDGQNAQRARGTLTGWLTYDINEDLYMILRQTEAAGGSDLPPTAQSVLANVQENNVNGVAITLAGSDPEGRSLTYHAVTQPTNGTLSLINGNVITYTPYNWHDGADSFQYVVNDGTQDSAQATVSINIQNVGAKTTSRIVVITLFEDGKTYSGLSTTLSQGSTTINSGFTQVHFQVNNGQNYSVNVPASGSKGTFVQWDNGSTSTSRSFNISQDTPVLAFYRR